MSSTAFCVTAIASGVLASAALGIFALIVVGIRKGDPRHLASPPASRTGAIARWALARVRIDDREARP